MKRCIYYFSFFSEVFKVTNKFFIRENLKLLVMKAKGVMNLYLCRGCSASLCLACGTVDVTKTIFMARFKLMIVRNICFFGHSSHLREVGLKMLELALW